MGTKLKQTNLLLGHLSSLSSQPTSQLKWFETIMKSMMSMWTKKCLCQYDDDDDRHSSIRRPEKPSLVCMCSIASLSLSLFLSIISTAYVSCLQEAEGDVYI